MDETFHPAIVAIAAGDLDEFRAQLAEDPGLATRGSETSHPTLLQFVAVDAAKLPNATEAAGILADAGAPLDAPLIAAAGCGSDDVLRLLLDRGGSVDGLDEWVPLDEAIYWCQPATIQTLLARGAPIVRLRQAAGLGRLDRLDSFFSEDGLTDDAGPIGSPFADTITPGRADDPQEIVDHAFVMAVNARQQPAAEALVERGARVNAAPAGYHWRGTALHAACWRGDPAIVEWLLSIGADPAIRDGLVDADALGWARHHDHPDIVSLLLA